MGKASLDRRKVKLSIATVKPSCARKRRAKQRGMKTRILGIIQGVKEFLLADTYMYGPLLNSSDEAAIYQCREGPGVLARDKAKVKRHASQVAEDDTDMDAAAGSPEEENHKRVENFHEENHKRRENFQERNRGLQDNSAGGREDSELGQEFSHAADQKPEDAAPEGADRPFLRDVEAHEQDQPRKEPVRIRLHKITRRAMTHTTVLATKQPVKLRDAGGDVEHPIQVPLEGDSKAEHPVQADGDGKAEEEAETESLDEPGTTEDSECSTGGGKADYVSVSIDEAAKVAQQLVDKFGGRYSEELGIDIDKSDGEVERWFLASVLFNHRSTFDPSPETLQKLQEGGIHTTADAADWKEADLAGLWESLGDPELYNRRTAARLHKLARELRSEYGGNISSLKGIRNQDELHEAISKLYGVGPSTAHAFLRELRGTWPGANPELGTRPLSALRHLRLVDPNVDAPYSVVCSSMRHIANHAGVDFRDLEAALIRFGHNHARNYRRCQGGLDCEMWTSIPQRTSQKHYKYA